MSLVLRSDRSLIGQPRRDLAIERLRGARDLRRRRGSGSTRGPACRVQSARTPGPVRTAERVSRQEPQPDQHSARGRYRRAHARHDPLATQVRGVLAHELAHVLTRARPRDDGPRPWIGSRDRRAVRSSLQRVQFSCAVRLRRARGHDRHVVTSQSIDARSPEDPEPAAAPAARRCDPRRRAQLVRVLLRMGVISPRNAAAESRQRRGPQLGRGRVGAGARSTAASVSNTRPFGRTEYPPAPSAEPVKVDAAIASRRTPPMRRQDRPGSESAIELRRQAAAGSTLPRP